MTQQKNNNPSASRLSWNALTSHPHRLLSMMTLCFVIAGISSCGRQAGVIFEPLVQMLRWPRPPEEPRIQYVGQLTQAEDLKPAQNFLELFGETLFGKQPTRAIRSPYALCTDGGNRLFVTDNSVGVIHVFDLASRKYEQWTPNNGKKKKTPDAADKFIYPVGVAYDPAGRLFVADSGAGRIYVFDKKGHYLGSIGGGLLRRPCGLAYDAEGDRLFVADSMTHQIVVINTKGQLITRIGQRGEALGQFNFPTNVALGPEGRLYVSDSLNFRVQVFDAALNPVRQIGSKGDLPGYFSHPKGLALDRDGILYVVDSHFEAVQMFNPEGELLMTFGHEGRGPGEFWMPAGIHIDAQNRVWVADIYNKRVQMFKCVETMP